jgi:hypothetical protein
MNDDAFICGKGWDSQLMAMPTTGWIVQPELYQLGLSKYYKCEGGAFPIVPNHSWKSYTQESTIPGPANTALDQILRKQNGWKTRFLTGIGVVHERDTPDLLASHRM